jgi:hypothetical protein
MVSFFSGGDLIRVALGIERRGIMFYETMARSTSNLAARQVFTELGEMERSHIDVFQNMLDDRDKYEVLESRQPGYDQYLKALVDTAIFTDEFITSDLATAADSDVKAIELGIRAERLDIVLRPDAGDGTEADRGSGRARVGAGEGAPANTVQSEAADAGLQGALGERRSVDP